MENNLDRINKIEKRLIINKGPENNAITLLSKGTFIISLINIKKDSVKWQIN